MNEKKTKNVMITITEQCNLNCVYCFEKNKSTKTISFKTAKEIVDKELAIHDNYDTVLFDIMGGEPFLQFGLIKQLCEYVWGNKWEKNYIFFTTTNGTLVHGDVKKWLIAHRDQFVCGLSLDGRPQTHNRNRSNSYDKIDIGFFKENWPDQPVKMTVIPETLGSLADDTIFLHSLGFEVKNNLAYGVDWSDCENRTILQKQLIKLIEYYADNTEVEPCSMISMDLYQVASQKTYPIKWCGMGGQMVAYDVNGVKFPCHFFQGMSNQDIDIEKLWAYDFDKVQLLLEPKCMNCILRNSCPTCYSNNYISRGDFGKKDMDVCELQKIIAVASATCAYKRKKLSNKDDLTNDDKILLKGIYMIQKASRTNDWCF